MGLLNATIGGLESAFGRITTFLGKMVVFQDRAVRDSGEILAERMRELAPEWTGQLKASIRVDKTSYNTVEVGPHVPYAYYMEFGAPPHVPPRGALYAWAEDKGMTVEAIVAKITEEGVDAQPFVMPAVEQSKPAIQAKVVELSAIVSGI
jgi:HK97 gp10 family phage protein